MQIKNRSIKQQTQRKIQKFDFPNKEKMTTRENVLKTPVPQPAKRAYVTEAVYRRTHAQLTAHRHGHTPTQTRMRLSPRAATTQRKRHRPSQRNIHIRRPYCLADKVEYKK
ncbi:hypothetical protein B5X24_HaOG208658 [Helicoverpa armigera]|uniref:Uncharacterized protein n=1 Tax=Helicoverpa armigera TaxID=29058 RepID=A0A2W1BKV5_HELAM|nr:hypothetical protein B5X24_HaOG208658 [Helicoverpa armigera]